MTTTLASGSLVVKLTETLTQNGKDIGTTKEYTIGSIVESSKRIVEVPTTVVDLFTLGAAVGAGGFVASTVKYMRFTNYDDTNFVTLSFVDDGADMFAVKLEAGQSFVLYDPESSFDVATGGYAAATLATIDTVRAIADTGDCDVEFMVCAI